MSHSLRPGDCSPPGTSVHGILQERILKWVTISSSRGSSHPRDWAWVPRVSCIAGGFFTTNAIWEAHTAVYTCQCCLSLFPLSPSPSVTTSPPTAISLNLRKNHVRHPDHSGNICRYIFLNMFDRSVRLLMAVTVNSVYPQRLNRWVNLLMDSWVAG